MAEIDSKLKLRAIKTVSPVKLTDPRLSLRLSVPESIGGTTGIYKRCFNLVFCYKPTFEEESASLVASWIKESLGIALAEQPILAGRLRQRDGDAGELDIVSNDSGVRLIEAQIDLSLQEFLDLKNRKEAEAALVFWEDIDHEINPQFSPLLYIQVTSFSCGAYSIGLSCSLLLTDPFSLISFLKAWTNLHLQILSSSDSSKHPIFYRRNPGNNAPSLDQSNLSAAKRASNSQTAVFSIATGILNFDNNVHKNFAEMCINEAESKLGLKSASRFSLYIKEPSEEIKIRSFDREGGMVQKPLIALNGIGCAKNWDDIGAEDICFNKDNKPAYWACWIRVADDDEAVVIFVPSLEEDGAGMKIIATLPL